MTARLLRTSLAGPRITIDLERIERNARTVVERCRASGIGVFGVTKGTCGMPQVARAMLRGGATGIGESRFENIRRLQIGEHLLAQRAVAAVHECQTPRRHDRSGLGTRN